MVITAMKLKDAYSLEEKLWPTKTAYRKAETLFADKGLSSQCYCYFSSHVWMWVLDYKKSWAPKNWCFWTMVLEETLENPLECKEIQPVHPKGHQSWMFIGMNIGMFNVQSWCWSWNSYTLATWCKELTHLKRPWERLKGRGKRDDRGWGVWMASPTQWT